jgi:uncharacterized OB-fold protein
MSVAAIDLAEPSEHLAEFRSALAQGRLTFQSCTKCANNWLPPRDHCPACLSDQWRWEQASGRARVISWVVYHRAYHPAFADRLPYNVVVAELDEGPRLITNVVDTEGGQGLGIDAPLRLVIEAEGDVPVARFHLADQAGGRAEDAVRISEVAGLEP